MSSNRVDTPAVPAWALPCADEAVTQWEHIDRKLFTRAQAVEYVAAIIARHAAQAQASEEDRQIDAIRLRVGARALLVTILERDQLAAANAELQLAADRYIAAVEMLDSIGAPLTVEGTTDRAVAAERIRQVGKANAELLEALAPLVERIRTRPVYAVLALTPEFHKAETAVRKHTPKEGA